MYEKLNKSFQILIKCEIYYVELRSLNSVERFTFSIINFIHLRCMRGIVIDMHRNFAC